MPVVGGDVKTARTAIGTIDDFAQTTLPQLGKVVTTLTGASLSSGDGQLNMEPIIAAAQQLATSTSPCNHRPGRSRIFPTPNSAW